MARQSNKQKPCQKQTLGVERVNWCLLLYRVAHESSSYQTAKPEVIQESYQTDFAPTLVKRPVYHVQIQILLFGSIEDEMKSMRTCSPEVTEESDQLGVLKYLK